MKITIDPGHTQKCNKGVVDGYYEGDAMFKLAQHLKKALDIYENVEVILTRGEKENPTLEERGMVAIKSKSKIFISLHSNATSNSETASYICGFYSVKRKSSKAFCGEIVKAVVDVMKGETDAWNRGALTKMNASGSDYYGVIRHSVSGDGEVEYSFIIEHGFHTNNSQCKFLMSDSNLKAIANAEAKAFAKYFNLNAKDAKLYSVEIGPIKGLSNAKETLDKVVKLGFNAFITEQKEVKSVETLAKEIINGLWGTGHTVRESKLKEAGWLDIYTYEEIRSKVNEICKKEG